MNLLTTVNDLDQASDSAPAQPAQPAATAELPQASAAPAPIAAPSQSKAVGMPAQASPAGTSVVAQPGTAAVPAPAGQPQGGGLFSSMPLLLLLAFGIMFIPMILSGRKEAKKKAQLLSLMRKGDRVQTAGGITGVITELGQDDVVLRMEEGRIRFAKSAIVGILKSSPVNGKADEGKPEINAAPV